MPTLKPTKPAILAVADRPTLLSRGRTGYGRLRRAGSNTTAHVQGDRLDQRAVEPRGAIGKRLLQVRGDATHCSMRSANLGVEDPAASGCGEVQKAAIAWMVSAGAKAILAVRLGRERRMLRPRDPRGEHQQERLRSRVV